MCLSQNWGQIYDYMTYCFRVSNVLLNHFIYTDEKFDVLLLAVERQNIHRVKYLDMYSTKDIPKITTHVLQEMKLRGEKIAMLTAYDFSMAKILDEAGIDVILVGDSASNVMAGHKTTLPITLNEMIYHASSVMRAVNRALVVVDMPFGTYQGNSKEALSSAIRIMKESGANAIKMEGGTEIVESIDRILSAGIPILGHLGLTPQSINKFGTYVVRATEEREAEKLRKDARVLEQSGCFGIVLEKIPASLAAEVTQTVKIPTIGIGAGSGVDGQVLVLHDMLGINQKFSPRFLRRYHNLYEEIRGSVFSYITDVKSVNFPSDREQY
jgi:3-methyl-2-oxobutanoate hydroxymethyltransferase